jgi:hypothetical protein
MLIGRKGNKLLDPGYIYAPYIPMSNIVEKVNIYKLRKSKISKIFNLNHDFELFTPSKMISSRYATKMINSNLYGVIGITGTTGPVGNPGVPGLYYKQWIRKTKIENIFNKKSS